MVWIIGVVLVLVAGVMAYIRLAPSDPADWHIDLEKDRREVMAYALMPPGSDLVRPLEGGAYADLFVGANAAKDLLAMLDAVAMAAPRTTRLAGNVAEGRITWITRSALWGFPDYTTAQVTPAGLSVYARLRFGRGDMGVNAARLRDWLAQL
jgi:hypothetical protein